MRYACRQQFGSKATAFSKKKGVVMKRLRVVRPLGIALIALLTLALAAPAAAQGAAMAALVSVGSPSGLTPRNHQNEPAVAIDAHDPDVLVAGVNDFIDQQPCPQPTTISIGSCQPGVRPNTGVSGVYFSFDRGHNWIQPEYTGWTRRGCDPATVCDGSFGPIGTLPWYYENGLVSFGDPAVAFGPIPDANGHFSWDNGSRVYYANLAADFNAVLQFGPGGSFKGFTAVAVSRLDNPTPTSVLDKNSWMPPVIAFKHSSETAFEDKEQIWADNAESSAFFGRVYFCSVQFRSVGLHLPANSPAPLEIGVSADGGTTWRVQQVTPAGTGGRGPIEFGVSGCTIRTDSHGVVYAFAEMFENPALVGLPTHGAHVMLKSSDGGMHWTKPQVLFRVTDPCYFVDPVYGRCVMDGYAGARTDLGASPSVDIANGAPTGEDATNEIVDAWSDAPALNEEVTKLAWSTDGGATWNGPSTVSLVGDRPIYSAPAISPDGKHVYVIYEAVTSPWRGDDMTSSRPYHGVLRTAAIGASGAPTGWSTAYNGPLGDIRGTYPGHDLYQERIGDYVYAAASRDYGVAVWTDAANAAVCGAIQDYRARSLAAGHRDLPAPWPLADCPGTFGNTDIMSASTAP
jgi:hypothetical protein